MTTYKIEMRTGEPQRIVEADKWGIYDDWMVFWRCPPQGGSREYWRVKSSDVVSMEAKA